MSLNTSLAACMFTGLIHTVRFSAAANWTQFVFVNHHFNLLFLSDLAGLFKHLIEYVNSGELLQVQILNLNNESKKVVK